MSLWSSISDAVSSVFGGGSGKVSGSSPLGQVYVTPSENNNVYGSGVTVVGHSSNTVSGKTISTPKSSSSVSSYDNPSNAVMNPRISHRGGGGGGSSGGGGGSQRRNTQVNQTRNKTINKVKALTPSKPQPKIAPFSGINKKYSQKKLSKLQLYQATQREMNPPNTLTQNPLINQTISGNKRFPKNRGDISYRLSRDIFNPIKKEIFNPIKKAVNKRIKFYSKVGGKVVDYLGKEGEKRVKFYSKAGNKAMNYTEGFLDKHLEEKNTLLPKTLGKTKGEVINKILTPMSYVSRGADYFIKKATEGAEIVKRGNKARNKLQNEYFPPLKIIPDFGSNTLINALPETVHIGGRFPLYAVPVVGQTLMASDISKSGTEYLGAGKKAEEITKEDYKNYSRLNPKNPLTYQQYSSKVQPNIKKQIKNKALLSGVISTAFLGSTFGVKALMDYGALKRFKLESANYDEVKSFADQQNKLAGFLPAKEYPAQEISIEKSNLQKLNRFGIKDLSVNDLNKVDSIKVSSSTQEIRVPNTKIVETNVPKDNPLYKKVDKLYTPETTYKKIFRNSIKVAIKDKNGNTKVYAKSFITKKPITDFRKPQTALKYGTNKKVIVSRFKSGENPIRQDVFKVRNGELKKGNSYLTKIKRIEPPKTKNLNVMKSSDKFYVTSTKRVGKLGDINPLSNQELFSFSPKTSSSIIKSESLISPNERIMNLDESMSYKLGVNKLTHLTNTEPLSTDFSTTKKIIQDINKFKKGVIKKGIRVGISEGKKFKLAKLDTPSSDIPQIKEVRVKELNRYEGLSKNEKLKLLKSQIEKANRLKLKSSKLDTPSEEYVPENVKISSLKTFDENTQPLIRPRTIKPVFRDISFSTEIPLILGATARTISNQIQNQKSSSINKTASMTKTKSAQDQKTKQAQTQKTKQAQTQKTKLITTQVNVGEGDFINPLITEQELPQSPNLPRKIKRRKVDLKIGFKLPSKEPILLKTTNKNRGYNVFIKSKGKYTKITKKPIALNRARDTRAYFLDETTARTGKIKATNQKANPLMYNVPRGYARKTRDKFRIFRQKKGRRTQMQNTIIEKSPFLIDTRGERRDLNIFKEMAKIEKKKKKIINKPSWEMFA